MITYRKPDPNGDTFGKILSEPNPHPAGDDIYEMACAALEEDAANPDRKLFGFTPEGFGNFFPEHTAEQIAKAWILYRQFTKGDVA